METLIVHPKNQKQLVAVEVVLKALDVDFKKESPYNHEFVVKIKKSESNFKEGKYITVKVEDLWR